MAHRGPARAPYPRQDKANIKLGETLPRHTVIAGLQDVVRIRGPAPLEAAKRRVR